jgi:hypothetical protein
MEGTYVTRHATGNKRTIDITRRLAQMLIADRCAPAGRAANELLARPTSA